MLNLFCHTAAARPDLPPTTHDAGANHCDPSHAPCTLPRPPRALDRPRPPRALAPSAAAARPPAVPCRSLPRPRDSTVPAAAAPVAEPLHTPAMDINSLLSPSDSPADTPPPPPAHASPSVLPAPSPVQRTTRQQMPSRTSSALSQQITSSPQVHLAHQNIPSPGYGHLANGARPMHSATSTPQPLGSPHDARMTPPSHMYRQASTPGMDALAGGYHVPFSTTDADSELSVLSRGLRVPHPQHACSAPTIPVSRFSDMMADRYTDLASMQQQQQAARQNSLGHQRPVT